MDSNTFARTDEEIELFQHFMLAFFFTYMMPTWLQVTVLTYVSYTYEPTRTFLNRTTRGIQNNPQVGSAIRKGSTLLHRIKELAVSYFRQ